MADEYNCSVAWTFFSTALLGNRDEDGPLPVLWSLLVFPNFLTFEWNTLLASSFRILSSFAGILSPPLALWAAVLLKTHVTSHSRRSGSEWENTPLWLSGSLSCCCCCCCLFVCLYSSSVYFFHPFLVYSALLNHKIPKSQSHLGKEEQCSRLGLLI